VKAANTELNDLFERGAANRRGAASEPRCRPLLRFCEASQFDGNVRIDYSTMPTVPLGPQGPMVRSFNFTGVLVEKTVGKRRRPSAAVIVSANKKLGHRS